MNGVLILFRGGGVLFFFLVWDSDQSQKENESQVPLYSQQDIYFRPCVRSKCDMHVARRLSISAARGMGINR